MPIGLRPISPWISRHAGLVPAGAEVLDLACGAGRHGRHFLKRGHRVCFVDRDVAGLSDLRGHARAELIETDLEQVSWPLGKRAFTAAVVVNYLYRPQFDALASAIGPGGILLYDTFARGNERYGKPSNPAYLLGPGELRERLSRDFDILDYRHGQVAAPRPAIKQSVCARRIG